LLKKVDSFSVAAAGGRQPSGRACENEIAASAGNGLLQAGKPLPAAASDAYKEATEAAIWAGQERGSKREENIAANDKMREIRLKRKKRDKPSRRTEEEEAAAAAAAKTTTTTTERKTWILSEIVVAHLAASKQCSFPIALLDVMGAFKGRGREGGSSVSTGKPFCHSRESGNANAISREFSGSLELIFT
jgi:hypothetical protein